MGSMKLVINGQAYNIDASPDAILLSVLREELDLTGSKYGCGEGRCGACTVVVDGKATRSCVTPVGECDGKRITTIEGLEHDGKLHPLQEAFLHVDAMQCGYCTAGMIMGGVAFLDKNPKPTTEDICSGMQGHICRCGTYARIIQAIHEAT